MTGRIEAFKAAVTGKIAGLLPQLKECRSLGGRFNLDVLSERTLKSPAVLVAVLKSPVHLEANGQVTLKANCAAFIVTEGREEDRDAQALVIAEAVLSLLGSTNHWGIAHIGLPEKVALEPVISAATRSKGVTLIAVTWSCSIRHIGADIYDNAGTVITELYVNGENLMEEPGGQP